MKNKYNLPRCLFTYLMTFFGQCQNYTNELFLNMRAIKQSRATFWSTL